MTFVDLDGVQNIIQGRTRALPENIEIILRARMAHQEDESSLLQALSIDKSVIEEAIAADVLDIRERISICIHLRQSESDFNRYTDTTEAIQKWYSLILQKTKLPVNLTIDDVEVYRKHPRSFSNEYFSMYLNF